LHTGKADGPLDRRSSANRTRGARQPRLQYGLVTERQVAVNVIVSFFFGGPMTSTRRRGGCCPGPIAHGPEPVAAVLVAVAVLLPAPAAASVPGLAREHCSGDE